MSLFPEPTPLEAAASVGRLIEDARDKARTAARMKDWRVVAYWKAEEDRLRIVKACALAGRPIPRREDDGK